MEKKNLSPIVLKTDYSRRFPDPLNSLSSQGPYNIEHHVLLVKAIDVPPGIPLEPNPRAESDRINYSIYKDVRKSLENADDPTFHLKNKGITILAHKVELSDDKKTAILYMGDDDGIADGGHTYRIILAAQKDKTCPDLQYIKFEVITGAENLGVDITEGLNTTVQVQPSSLDNLRGKFDWVKKTIKDMPYANEIGYEENENKEYDIREIVSIMTMFNVKHFPASSHPKMAYVSKAKCLELYEKDQESFEMLKPILKDVLYLSDYVSVSGYEKCINAGGAHPGGWTGVYEGKKKNQSFLFMQAEHKYRMYDGALYPILGALRFLVERKKGDTTYSWRLDSFNEVKKFFDEIAPKLLTTTYNTSITFGRKPNPIGKSDNHWEQLYQTAELHYLRTKQIQ